MQASFLDLVNLCDNVHIDWSSLTDTKFGSEQLSPFYLTTSLDSPVIGLLRPPIVDQLRKENETTRAHGLRDTWSIIEQPPGLPNGLPIYRVSFNYWVDTAVKRSAIMKALCERWRDTGLFEDVCGPKKWRSEPYPVYSNPFGKHDYPGDRDSGSNYAFEMERSACALFGVVTYGVHMTIYRDSNEGLKQIWIPTRATTKPTVAGGIPSGMGIFQSLVKESMEEAGIEEDIIQKHAKAVGVVSYFFRSPQGWLQPEVEYVYDLCIPPGANMVAFEPKPHDDEVDRFDLLSLSSVMSKMRASLFKPNCALVLIDFLIRHGHLTPDNEDEYMEILTRLHTRFDYEKWHMLSSRTALVSPASTSVYLRPMIPSIPIDVLQLILKLVDKASLAKICLLNKTCCSYSQDFLYRDIRVINPRRGCQVYRTLAQSTYLARRVRSFEIRNHDYRSERENWELQISLRNTINLRRLRFGYYKDFSVLDGCTFTLDSFENIYDSFEPLHRFLHSQPSLTKFELDFAYAEYDNFPTFGATVLPNLTRITTHFNLLQQLIPNRPVSEVTAYGGMDYRDSVGLSFFALSTAPIRKLTINYSYLYSIPVTLVASIFPSLTHLRMDVPFNHGHGVVTHAGFTEWIEWIKKLLATLVSLRVFGVETDPDRYDPTGGHLQLITDVLNRAPNLEYMVIRDDVCYSWKRVRGEWVLCDEAEVP